MGGDYDRHGMRQARKVEENIKLLLSEVARSNVHTKLLGNPI